MPMLNPPHPGAWRQECMEPLNLAVTEGAKALGVTRQAPNNLVHGKAGSSYDLIQVKLREPEIVASVRHIERLGARI